MTNPIHACPTPQPATTLAVPTTKVAAQNAPCSTQPVTPTKPPTPRTPSTALVLVPSAPAQTHCLHLDNQSNAHHIPLDSAQPAHPIRQRQRRPRALRPLLPGLGNHPGVGAGDANPSTAQRHRHQHPETHLRKEKKFARPGTQACRHTGTQAGTYAGHTQAPAARPPNPGQRRQPRRRRRRLVR
jgi:hypothetical protein